MVQGTGQTFQNLGTIGLTSIGGAAPAFQSSSALQLSPAMEKLITTTGKLPTLTSVGKAASSIKRALASRAGTIRAAAGGTINCVDAGTAVYTINSASAGSFNVTITFTGCRENDTQIDGQYIFTGTTGTSGTTGTTATLDITLGSANTPFTIEDFSTGYGSVISRATSTALSLGINIAESASSLTYTMNASGAMTLYDEFTGNNYTITFSNGFNDVYALLSAGTGSTSSFSITANGSYAESWTTSGVTTSVSSMFSNLALTLTFNSTSEALSINGQYTITFTPASCLNGTFSFVTNTPVQVSVATGLTDQGSITINGVTTITFNANGTITVTTAGVSQTYNSVYALDQECPIATLDEPAPLSSGSTGTTTVPTSGTAMTITLTWNETGNTAVSNDDMDLHLNYYNVTAPTGSTQPTWHVDWDLSSGTSTTVIANLCTAPAGVTSYRSALDLTGAGNCDVLLDQDNVVGFGPEHIIATMLPAGYYVVSINNYSFHGDTSEDVKVTIEIGNSLFGPFTSTMTAADGEGSDPASWFGAADIVVSSSGVATVRAHNPSLLPWDEDNPFGLGAPGLRVKGGI